ncbi:hypothetical protein G5B40_05570 [Pikeienuella piscinae]|uniref:Toprim domain-containing protein n=1 Tax=Pikeienuella piscinae TaxID=2748098 RepID=A0A7L5BXI8_9RHOB|nr:toprim domain-containing protein [Pikeienuella piscinae]QIE54966.1 hypothetical protein G5B40_05570 [Pikeienuella piscinae]
MTEAHRITRALKGRWYGRYGAARCPAHSDRKPSLTLTDGAGGRLLAHCKTGCAFVDVLDALRGLGVIEGAGDPPRTDPAKMASHKAEQRREAEKRERQAVACWNEAGPVHGSVAETYLRRRAISCDLPDSLRFHPECWHPSAKRLPALVALVEGVERFAVHRTYLRPDGAGKADAEPRRAMLGACAGGAVRLMDAPGPLVVAEGIETALSLACGLLPRPATIWAALSTSGMSGLRLPDGPSQKLTIATDGEAAGQAAGRALAERASALGWTVSILPAPDGRDWNDILRLKGTAA